MVQILYWCSCWAALPHEECRQPWKTQVFLLIVQRSLRSWCLSLQGSLLRPQELSRFLRYSRAICLFVYLFWGFLYRIKDIWLRNTQIQITVLSMRLRTYDLNWPGCSFFICKMGRIHLHHKVAWRSPLKYMGLINILYTTDGTIIITVTI